MPRTDTEQKDVSTLVKRNVKTIITNRYSEVYEAIRRITACKIRRLMIVWNYEREGR